MRISAISDVHVKRENDQAYDLLLKFLKHPLVRESNYVLLLGDIFDLMCGNHIEYLFEFEEIFSEINYLASTGVKVLFFEGNHDLHLNKLLRRRIKDPNFEIHTKPKIIDVNQKTYYFSHGDEHEVENKSYQRYKKIISSKPLEFVANYCVPYLLLKTIGEKASEKSRKRGAYFFDEAKVRNDFRAGVQQTTLGQYDFVLGGHSHVKDEFSFNQSKYVNNGYALKEKTFISILNHEINFIPLL